MEYLKTQLLELNPHIRGIKAAESYKKLSDKGKTVYNMLMPKDNYEDEENLYPVRYFQKRILKSRFTPVELSPSKLKKKKISPERFSSTLKSTSKDFLMAKTRKISPIETEEIEKIVKTKLDNELTTVKQSIQNKIKKLSIYKIFPDEMNTLRAESLAAVKSKEM
jgi:hypothetical protein